MKQKLSIKEYIYVASMLFGLFFGAGNLIFPIHLGQLAGSHIWIAVAGLLITAVGMPLMSVAALGISRSDGLYSLSSKVGHGYGMFFTCALYLTIGPAFAIPRCATTSFTVGVVPLLSGGSEKMWLLGFSLVFFLLVLCFSLRPSGILTWVGRIINPVFLIFLFSLIIASALHPMASISQVAPEGSYAVQPFLQGFLEGYNTMDTLAALAFGITIVQVIRQLGVEQPADLAKSTCLSGIFSCLLMAVIYALIAWMGAQSRGGYPLSENGGIALADIATHYFGRAGHLILAATVTLACAATGFAGVLAVRFRPHILRRFATWGHAWEYASAGGYQQTRAMMCIASGGLFGLGAGNGWLKYVFAADTDLVFAFLCEEWGLIIGLSAVAVIVILAVFTVRSAKVGRSSFYTIAACAAVAILTIQTILNVFGTMDLLPLTGVTFPFLSNGGSSMLASWGLIAFLKAADTRQNASFAVRTAKAEEVEPLE